MPLTGQDFPPKEILEAEAELERARMQPAQWERQRRALTQKLALMEAAYHDRLLAQPYVTAEERVGWATELGIEKIRTEIQDTEKLLVHAPAILARAQQAHDRVVAEHALPALRSIEADVKDVLERAFTTAREFEACVRDLRPLVRDGHQWIGKLGKNPGVLIPPKETVSGGGGDLLRYLLEYFPERLAARRVNRGWEA